MNRRVAFTLAVVLLVAGLVWMLWPAAPSIQDGSQAGSGKQKPGGSSAIARVERADAPQLRSKREERRKLSEFAERGLLVEADELGAHSAEGNVRISFPEGGGVEAEALQVSVDGDLVAHGVALIRTSKGEEVRSDGANNVVIGFDEEKKMVSIKMNSDSGVRITLESE